MRSCLYSIRHAKTITVLVFAAQLLIAMGILQPNAAAQDAGNAAALAPEPPPPPVVFQNPIPGNQLAFLNDYAGKPSKDLLKDKRFRELLKLTTPRTVYHYGRDMPLEMTRDEMLDGSALPVFVRDGRYVMVTSKGGPILFGKGFMWIDMKDGIALGGVFFRPINGEPTPTLAVFSRQLKDTSLSMSQLPLAFAEDVSRWAPDANVPALTVRYFIPENGKKYVLVHDEDYCDHPENATAPPQNQCQALNADAADIDMNAAYFMHETGNAANATAWGLGPDQVAWIGLRDRRCGTGFNNLRCRISYAHERTRLLIGGRR